MSLLNVHYDIFRDEIKYLHNYLIISNDQFCFSLMFFKLVQSGLVTLLDTPRQDIGAKDG
ncbi:hypothetical protein IC582_023241 [Cucumis melo]